MEREIQKTVTSILRDKDIQEISAETDFDLDEEELKKHLEFVIREVKKTEVDK